MSGSEVLIYGYGAVCLSMIVFNIIYNIVLRRKEPKTTKRAEQLRKVITETYGPDAGGKDNLPASDVPEITDFFKNARLKPERSEDLLTLSEALSGMTSEGDQETAERFIRALQSQLPRLAELYLKKDNMQKAYFAAFLQNYRRSSEYDSFLLERLLKYASQENMYCRINALDALYAVGNAEYVVKAVAIQDRMEVFLHEKVLTEGLLSFSGDHGKLTARLLERFDGFSVKTRHAVLNYIRFQSGNYKEFMYRIMTDEKEDRELRLSAIRYFGRYPWDPARECLIAFAEDKELLNWEYAAVAAASLKDYRGEDVIRALKSALYSSNWYVRYNAAESLEAGGFSYSQLMDVMAGKDRYAREMMGYRLQGRRLMEKEGGERV